MLKSKAVTVLVATLVAILTGCTPNDDRRLVDMAERHEVRQAQQNQQLAQLQEHVAEGSKELVEADAQARQEAATLARELQAERAEIGDARDALEAERRDIARQRHHDAIVAQAIAGAALLVACALPLVICWQLLRQPEDTAAVDVAAAELVLEDLVAVEPLLLPRQPSVPSIGFDNAAAHPRGLPPTPPTLSSS